MSMTPNDEPPTVEEIAAAVAPIVDRVRRQLREHETGDA